MNDGRMGRGQNGKGGNRYGVEKTVGKEVESKSDRKRRQQGEEWAGLWRGERIGKGGNSYGVGKTVEWGEERMRKGSIGMG